MRCILGVLKGFFLINDRNLKLFWTRQEIADNKIGKEDLEQRFEVI